MSLLANSRGRRLIRDLEVVGSNPHCRDHFKSQFIWIKSMETKIEWKLTWHCCICCNPAKGRDFMFTEGGKLHLYPIKLLVIFYY